MKISIGRLKEIIMEEVAKAAAVEERFKPASEMPPEWQAKAQPGSPAARQLQIPKCNRLLQQMEYHNEEESSGQQRYDVRGARDELAQSPEWIDCKDKGLFAETEIGKAAAARKARWDAEEAEEAAAKAAGPLPTPPRRAGRDPYLSETLNIEIVDDE